jgi:hypothetical protein
MGEENFSTQQAPIIPPKNSSAKNAVIIVLGLVFLAICGYFVFYFSKANQKTESASQVPVTNTAQELLTQQLKEKDQQIKELDEQNVKLSGQLSSLDFKTRKYLELKKDICPEDQTADSCLDGVFSVVFDSPISYRAEGGICIIRDAYTNMPSESSPNLGKGYAKMTKEGVNNYLQLQAECTEKDYDKLLQLYCQQNSNPAYLGVATVNKFGGVEASACSQFGCGAVTCPPK